MKLRRIISIILAVCLISSACLISASAADTKWEPKNEQPFIFVHGLNGWGGAEAQAAGHSHAMPQGFFLLQRTDRKQTNQNSSNSYLK